MHHPKLCFCDYLYVPPWPLLRPWDDRWASQLSVTNYTCKSLWLCKLTQSWFLGIRTWISWRVTSLSPTSPWCPWPRQKQEMFSFCLGRDCSRPDLMSEQAPCYREHAKQVPVGQPPPLDTQKHLGNAHRCGGWALCPTTKKHGRKF